MAHKTVGVALLGCGTVGGGVVALLTRDRALLTRRTGVDFVLRHVVVKSRDEYPPNAAELPMGVDADAAIDDPQTDIVVELIGGTGVAYRFVKKALEKGKPVVTANKALLATHGPELFALARKNNVCIAFEASAGGGIPIINALQHGLAANRVDALLGIVNGTCNFILSKMTQNGWSYDQALKEAQAQGFAEANPHMDVSGKDSMQKLAILAGLAFNVGITDSDIHLEGIDGLNAIDIKFADELGYVIKLLAIAERVHPDSLALRVHPTLVHKADLLAQVSGSFNAVSFYGHALGHALFYGRGAGRMPTASAVVADLIDVATGVAAATFRQLGVYMDQVEPAKVVPVGQLRCRYYLRLTARDVPGVMAKIATILSRHKISLAGITQHESDEGQLVPIVITTHAATEGDVRKAIAEIDALPDIQPATACLRIMEPPKEFAA